MILADYPASRIVLYYSLSLSIQVFNELKNGKPIPNKFACIEHWASAEAIKAHMNAEHVKVFREKVKAADIYVAPMNVKSYAPSGF